MSPPLLVVLVECAVVVAIFLAARRVAARFGSPAWASPVLITAFAVGLLLWLAGQPLAVFTERTAPLRWLLGPAIVSLGAVIHARRGLVRAQALPLAVAVAGGSAVGVASALGFARLLGIDSLLTTALATKSFSTPFAVAIATRVGGPVPLAAALAALTGIVGAVAVPPLLRLLRIRGSATIGVAMGQSSHIVGTDSLNRRDPHAAAWSAVTMVLAGVLAAVVLPLVWRWLA